MSAVTTQVRPGIAYGPASLAIGVGLLALGALFWPECQAAVRVWIDSTAYGHCFLVAPIALYLAWDRRDSLRGLAPRPTPALLLLGLPLPFAWFAAERLGIMEGRQLVAIGFVELLFLVVLGRPLFRALLAPLAYLVFLVPFGAFITPVLQSFTAHFIDVGLTILGIPHFANDMIVEIDAGTFYVAEACAGLRFLIASVAFGVFYALLNYRSPGRRVAFIAASIVVPIIANGFRALGIVVLGTILGSAEAAAADHIIYGWVFFSFVMLLLVAAGLPMREPPAGPRSWPATAARQTTAAPWPALLAVVLAALAPMAALALDRNAPSPSLPASLALRAPEGCTLTPAPSLDPGRQLSTIRCADRSWTVTTLAVPARSTGASLAEARRTLLGTADPEDVTTATLPNTPPRSGNWTSTVSRNPAQVTGIAAWVHGRPAGGGLAQRLLQARDSVFGNTIPPLLVAITLRPDHALAPREAEAAVAELGRIVAAQPDLDAEVARLTNERVKAPSSPPPPQ